MRRLKGPKIGDTVTDSIVPYDQCPAKTRKLADGSTVIGHNVFTHCLIVALIARELISRFPGPIQKKLFPKGCELVAGCHDIGKVSPTFVAKLLSACGVDYRSKPELNNYDPILEKQWGGHAGVSQATAIQLNIPPYIPEILGQHHGFSPNIADKKGDAEVFGGQMWLKERHKLVEALKYALDVDWPTYSFPAQARVSAGLTSVADWIGSGEHFEDPSECWHLKISHALDEAGFIRPPVRKGLSFSQVFDPIDLQMVANNTQALFVDQVSGPGVYILEAQMGIGKTEAALYAAYRLLEQDKAVGIYFALPTQLTSNKIYGRFNKFLSQILISENDFESLLLHSGAWLLNSELGEEAAPGGAWFNQRKRGLLAPFAVGTIDQALMAVMNVKHSPVRAYGLAGKVVILDEVHSYDLYTGTIFTELVTFLRKINCTIIILSATLSESRRYALLRQSGGSTAYPLISALSEEQGELVEIELPTSGDEQMLVHINFTFKDEIGIQEAISRALSGQQVLWIENTVTEAQQVYIDLCTRTQDLDCEVGLVHSRFTPQHRSSNEQYWVALYGKEGWSERQRCGRILVGTQVLEQSLDIDADYLVTRIAPTDMLLQRIGRLWRHSDTPRPNSALKETMVLSPQLCEALNLPETHFGLSAWVYSPYVLCRSLAVWQGRKAIMLPGDIRPLIDETYIPRHESGPWHDLKQELENGTRFKKGQHAQEELARITLSTSVKILSEDKAETRYSDQDTQDVLLIRSITVESHTTIIRLLDDSVLRIPHERHRLSKSEWRRLAISLHQQVVRINPIYWPQITSLRSLKRFFLHEVFHLGHSDSDRSLLHVALVNEHGVLFSHDGQPISQRHLLEYRADIGLITRSITG